jgi:hypothetical protein
LLLLWNDGKSKRSFTDSFNFLQVREAQLAQYNYILVVGEDEAKTGEVLPIH